MTGSGLFYRQFRALLVKNWIVLSKHPVINSLRCFIIPIAWGAFVAYAETFLVKPNNYGIGNPVQVHALADNIDGSMSLVWADGTAGNTSPTADQIMTHITAGFSDKQLGAIKKVGSPSDIPAACPENFNDFSECYAAVSFNTLPTSSNDTTPLNYTIRADGGLFHIDVFRHSSDYEKRILPLQWAIDSAIIELRSGSQVPAPLEWPYTQETNKEQFTKTRLDFVKGVRDLFVIALFINFVGISYQLPGAYAGERAAMLTSHMQAMGLLNWARMSSWHFSLSLAYLPAWIISAVFWQVRIFSGTNVGIVIVIHVLAGLSLASYSFFVAAPFGKSPQLAAVASTFLAILFTILALVFHTSTGGAILFTIIFPPGFYVFAVKAMAGYEVHLIPTNAIKGDPDHHLTLLPLFIAAIINIFLWPYLAVVLERSLYDAREPSLPWFSGLKFWQKRQPRSGDDVQPSVPLDIAISIRNLNKTFPVPWWKRKKSDVVAIEDLTFDVPKFGIFVLLGSNGAGKSTALSIIGNLWGRTSGSVTFEGGVSRPPRGTIGIVPQKNVLFSDLTCYQTLKLWSDIKRPKSGPKDDLDQLLKECDLGHKVHANAGTLSGGQKRKLQLAIGLVGGSKILLVDECTSGVDPLSRRALWKTLTGVRDERTVLFTTHFLDEADLLADHIAILAAPGKLVAEGSPVSLKSTLGQGYSLHVSLNQGDGDEKAAKGSPHELLTRIRAIIPSAVLTSSSPTEALYHLQSKDPVDVEKVLNLVEAERSSLGVSSYDVRGTSMEDIFLSLMKQHGQGLVPTGAEMQGDQIGASQKALVLTSGRPKSPLAQALTIFHKRALVARRSWLTPLLAVVIAICGACIPIFFIAGRPETCVTGFVEVPAVSLYFPDSFLQDPFSAEPGSQILMSPPGIIETLGQTTASLSTSSVADNLTFVDTIEQTYRNLSLGGVSIDQQSGAALVAWEASPPGLTGPTMLNLASNILYNRALNTSGRGTGSPSIISANYQPLPAVDTSGLVALKWNAFFGAAMAVFPAFFALYVANERRSSVQAMQLSNGLTNPVGLWIGHLMFDGIFTVIIATVIIIVFAVASNQFNGLGFFWLIIVLYGIAGTLFAYCATLITSSALAAFAAVAAYQMIIWVLYVASYLLTLTYAKTSSAGKVMTINHFTLSLITPVNNVDRAALLSVNLFSLLCDGSKPLTVASTASISKFGGPIVYLIGYSLFLFGILVWFDSGSNLPRRPSLIASHGEKSDLDGQDQGNDVLLEADNVLRSNDSLRVINVTKSFDRLETKAVDNVSFGVSHDTVMALLGPNGAGKTTAFNVIRGDIFPNHGDVLIQGTSVVTNPRTARLSLGVCPQFTAIDSQLTVREHLMIYGRLKGLRRGAEVNENVEALMGATALSEYADRLASKLSGGNQRKLSLAIALIGNPSVILIDEFSTGIDAKMKRDMWETLRNVAVGKAVVITTHSMEEASALANKVGIIASKMLAIGSTESLASRYPIYEVHFSCRTREDVTRAQQLMAKIPGSRMADDVATRFEVPVDGGRTLSDLFKTLNASGDFSEYTVERVSLESVFLKVIRANNVKEEDQPAVASKRWIC
ncbi:P-loop containing nucleoside triphosphate hydrolase protein [Rickenella mellea]|uniref:P-loop containing nucleoside triphosphate hydrolase protein n=1 Tax=Rickenella mellea TaxID=50990 RepID=A0A4Y7QGC9_9AGAM|nr:P-loop containing nucleoside triphosphate hydrolase protein [Rickenella mellea]